MSDWPLLGETVIRRTSVVLVFWALALMIASPIGGPAMFPAFPAGNIAIVLILAAFGYDTERASLGMWPLWAPYAVLTLGSAPSRLLHPRRTLHPRFKSGRRLPGHDAFAPGTLQPG
jgi:hypothetical protein